MVEKRGLLFSRHWKIQCPQDRISNDLSCFDVKSAEILCSSDLAIAKNHSLNPALFVRKTPFPKPTKYMRIEIILVSGKVNMIYPIKGNPSD
jgi:hypothetical protein